MALDGKATILLTFDVEDWFQVENFKGLVPFSSWNRYELRVRQNTEKILQLLADFPFPISATFFLLGWVAEKCPRMVRDILAQGHEVASHGYGHALCGNMSVRGLYRDLRDSKALLEDLTGEPVYGYRAPSFSISDAALAQVKRAGYTYDSSFNSFASHGRYGSLDLSDAVEKKGLYQMDTSFYEVPVSNLTWGGRVIPLGGGGYFRLFPGLLFQAGIKQVLKKQDHAVIYLHPWEFDPDQPRMEQAPTGFKFRHYVNLSKTHAKLTALIQRFSPCRFQSIHGFLKDGVMDG